jgi:membrane associated rhomboid family serine protease
MLIVPVTGKISWRNPPVVTIGFIIVNCLVFFLFQFNEGKLSFEAEEYYFKSGLAAIELSHYVDYRNISEDQGITFDDSEKMKMKKMARLRNKMVSDSQFLAKLRNDEIITPHDPEYPKWKKLRRNYEQKQLRIVSMKYGFRPAHPRIYTFFTHMFLHGGFGHLFGNMIFLWLVGCMLEMGCGRKFYSAIYVLTGLCAVVLYWLIYMESTIPLVGASGAIAGFMGAFTVLYGKKKVKIFYSLGFYFNYLKVPAIFLLPVWIANEFYQLFFGGVSQVAYVAHIGGLVSGAHMGVVNLKFIGAYDAKALEPEEEDEISPLIEDALEHISQLDMESGIRLLNKVLVKDPDNVGAMIHLFNVRKTDPEDLKFHEIARRLLNRLSLDSADFETARKVYEDYTKLTKRPRLSSELYLRLSSILAGLGYPEKAEGILVMLLKKRADLPGIPTALLKLAKGYQQKKLVAKNNQCLKILYTKYPDSPEAQIAGDLLKKSIKKKST